MRRWLPALLFLWSCVLSAQGLTVQGSVNSSREYSLEGVTLPAFSLSAGWQSGKHWYCGARFENGFTDADGVVTRRNGLAGETRFYITKGWYAGASLGILSAPGPDASPVTAWSLTLLGTRQALGSGFYLVTELAVGNLSPGTSFGFGYCPQYVRKRDSRPVENRWEIEAGFPFFAYAGYRLRNNVAIGVTAEAFRKQMKVDGVKMPAQYALAAVQARFYFLQLGGFGLYSATGGGLARLTPQDEDLRTVWFWDNTLFGVRYRVLGNVYMLGELKSGSLAFGGRFGFGVRL